MVWVKSEYAGELAVLSAWLSALLPWYVSYTPDHVDFPGTVAFVRFPWVQIRYVFGFDLADAVVVSNPWTARGMIDREAGTYLQSLHLAYDLWLVATVIVALAVVLSVAMYADEAAVVERLPVHPVRLMGGLLGAAGVLMVVATVLFHQRTVFGGEVPIPVGLLVLLVLSGVLLRVELLEDETTSEGGDAAT